MAMRASHSTCLPASSAAIVISACVYGHVPMQIASTFLSAITSRQSKDTRGMPNSFATRSLDSFDRLATVTSSTPCCFTMSGMWNLRVLAPAPMYPTRIVWVVMPPDAPSCRDRNPAPGQFRFEVEGEGALRGPVRHRPEHFELQPVGILRVERQAHAVIGHAHERADFHQSMSRVIEIAQLTDLPRRVVHARHALVRRPDPGLLEQSEIVIVPAAGDAEKRRLRALRLHLEAEHVPVEPHAALDVGDPQHEVLESFQSDHAHAIAYTSSTPSGSWFSRHVWPPSVVPNTWPARLAQKICCGSRDDRPTHIIVFF